MELNETLNSLRRNVQNSIYISALVILRCTVYFRERRSNSMVKFGQETSNASSSEMTKLTDNTRD